MASKKKVFDKLEKLRPGLHNPKRLLNLVDYSSNAIERTKRLELLKSAGHVFNPQGKKASFVDKVNAAILRLELGHGTQSPQDTLLFGTKVLSSSGFLSARNFDDIENNQWKEKPNECISIIMLSARLQFALIKPSASSACLTKYALDLVRSPWWDLRKRLSEYCYYL